MKDERKWLYPSVEVRLVDGQLLLVPLSKRAKRLFSKMMKKPGCDVWGYCGADFNNRHTKDFVIWLRFAANPVIGLFDVGEHSVKTSYNGDYHLHLGLVSSDHQATARLRNMCFFGGDIRLIPYKEMYQIVSVEHCKVCSGPLRSMVEAEWETCNDCAKVCEHQYVPGITHGKTVGYAPFCTICGRVDPDHTRDPMAELAMVVNEGNVDTLILNHDDGSVTVLGPKTMT